MTSCVGYSGERAAMRSRVNAGGTPSYLHEESLDLLTQLKGEISQDDRLVKVDAAGPEGLVKVTHPVLQRAREAVDAHELVDRVHLLGKHLLVDVELGGEGGDLADHVGEDAVAHEYGANDKEALQVCARHNVAVANGGDGDEGPVQANEVA